MPVIFYDYLWRVSDLTARYRLIIVTALKYRHGISKISSR